VDLVLLVNKVKLINICPFIILTLIVQIYELNLELGIQNPFKALLEFEDLHVLTCTHLHVVDQMHVLVGAYHDE